MSNYKDIVSVVQSFYLYLMQEENYEPLADDKRAWAILSRTHAGLEISDGFDIIFYNPLEAVPNIDKWLFCFQNARDEQHIETRIIDFTIINNSVYRSWYKHYVWYADASPYTKFHPLHIFKVCLDYLAELKDGKSLSIFTKKNRDYSFISVGEATAIKNHIYTLHQNNRTQNGYIYNLRALFSHVADNHLGTIESGVFYVLTNSLHNDYDNTHALTQDELKAVSRVMQNKATSDLVSAIYYSIFYIALETEFRGSQILQLTKDCVMETAKRGEYVLVSKTKTSSGELVEQPITEYVKREIDEIIKATESFRQECTNINIKELLFIVPGLRKGTYTKLTATKFNHYFQKCCEEAGIRSYSLENLRDTHMTKAEEFIIRQSLSQLEQSVLTGHRSQITDTVHYVDSNIRTMLEAVHGVVIGNVTVEGKVRTSVDPKVAIEENEVSNGCGYCNSSSCNIFSYLDCMLCKDFVTTINRLPYFEEQIKIIDNRIKNDDLLPHDKEDLINIKILLLHYVEEILKLKDVTENAV